MFLNLSILAQAAAEETSDKGLLATFGVDLPHFISQLVVFSILAFILKKYAFDPILKVLDERRGAIKQSLDNAEKIKQELAAAEATRKEILQKANEQAGALIAEAQKVAAAQGERQLKEAVAQAEQFIQHAHEAAETERQRLLAETKQEVARLVIETTAKVTGKVLTPEDQNRLNEETVRQLAQQN